MSQKLQKKTSQIGTGKVMKVSRKAPLVERLNLHAAGIDVGAGFHVAPVPTAGMIPCANTA